MCTRFLFFQMLRERYPDTFVKTESYLNSVYASQEEYPTKCVNQCNGNMSSFPLCPSNSAHPSDHYAVQPYSSLQLEAAYDSNESVGYFPPETNNPTACAKVSSPSSGSDVSVDISRLRDLVINNDGNLNAYKDTNAADFDTLYDHVPDGTSERHRFTAQSNEFFSYNGEENGSNDCNHYSREGAYGVENTLSSHYALGNVGSDYYRVYHEDHDSKRDENCSNNILYFGTSFSEVDTTPSHGYENGASFSEVDTLPSSVNAIIDSVCDHTDETSTTNHGLYLYSSDSKVYKLLPSEREKYSPCFAQAPQTDISSNPPVMKPIENVPATPVLEDVNSASSLHTAVSEDSILDLTTTESSKDCSQTDPLFFDGSETVSQQLTFTRSSTSLTHTSPNFSKPTPTCTHPPPKFVCPPPRFVRPPPRYAGPPFYWQPSFTYPSMFLPRMPAFYRFPGESTVEVEVFE